MSRQVRKRYIEHHDSVTKFYNGRIAYEDGTARKRQNKDLPTTLAVNGLTIFYGKQMSNDGILTSLYFSRNPTLKRNVNTRHILRTSELVSNRITTARAYNGTERHHHEALKKRRGKPSKIRSDGAYFIPKIVIMPDGISRPVRSNIERTDKIWLQTRW